MIDDPVLRPVRTDARRAEKNHHVIWKLLDPGLIKEKQVARLRLSSIARHEETIEILQRAPVGKLRESAIAQVAFMESSKISAKDFFAERVVVEIEFTHIGRHGFIAGAHLLKPDPVMTTQRF